MRKVYVVTAGLLVVLAGTASAGTIDTGKAYGNCKQNAVGGKDLGTGGVNNGHGLGGYSKQDTAACGGGKKADSSAPGSTEPSGPLNG
jgi:hypothetical protein